MADELGVELLTADGFDEAVLGIGRQFDRMMVVYDRSRCIELLMADGMTRDEALEYFEFNVAGAWVGESTPLFLERPGE